MIAYGATQRKNNRSEFKNSLLIKVCFLTGINPQCELQTVVLDYYNRCNASLPIEKEDQ